MTQKPAAKAKSAHHIDAKQYEITEYDDQSVSVRMPIGAFIDLRELMGYLAGNVEEDFATHQTNLNYAMRKFITANKSYCEVNMAALSYFNEVITNLSKANAFIFEFVRVLALHELNTSQKSQNHDVESQNHAS